MPETAQTAALDHALLSFAAERDLGALATLKRDGRPQLSMVNFTLDLSAPAAPSVRVSVVDGRAKVRNLLRDPRGSLMVTSEDGSSYAVLEGDVELSPVAGAEDDAVVDELVELFRTIRGQDHPDWDDYRRAMVQDGRRILRLRVDRVYGLIQ